MYDMICDVHISPSHIFLEPLTSCSSSPTCLSAGEPRPRRNSGEGGNGKPGYVILEVRHTCCNQFSPTLSANVCNVSVCVVCNYFFWAASNLKLSNIWLQQFPRRHDRLLHRFSPSARSGFYPMVPAMEKYELACVVCN